MPTGDAEPSPATTITLPDGREVPADLTGLLGVRHAHLARALVAAGIESAAHLLSLDDHDRRFTPGMGAARWKRVAEALPEGVTLGCLVERPTEPVQLRAIEGGRPREAPRPGSQAWFDEQIRLAGG